MAIEVWGIDTLNSRYTGTIRILNIVNELDTAILRLRFIGVVFRIIRI